MGIESMCSFGNNTFYLLFPDYQEEHASRIAKKAKLR